MVLFIDLRVQCGADVDNQGYDHTARAGQNKSNRQHLNSTHRVRHSPSSRLASIRPMDDKYDWEVWDPTSLSFRHHMIAGIFAGVSEHIVFFPIDTVRVRFPTASGDFLDDTPGGLFRRNPSQYQGPARRLPCGGGLSRRCIPGSTSFALPFTRRGMQSSTQSTTSFGSTCIHRDGEFFGEACLPRSARASPPTHCTFRFTSPQRPIWEERTTNISTTIDFGLLHRSACECLRDRRRSRICRPRCGHDTAGCGEAEDAAGSIPPSLRRFSLHPEE